MTTPILKSVYVAERMCRKAEWYAHNVRLEKVKRVVKMENEPKNIIWSDYYLDLEDWRESLEEEYPGYSDDELTDIMYKTNAANIYDERCNLDIKLPRPIIIIGDIGRWDCRVMGYKEIESGNIKDCLYSECDYNTWYVDKKGDLRCTAVHHDAANYYLYRTYKDGVSEEQIEDFKYKIYTGKVTREDINRITDRLGDEIGKVYGWEFPKNTEKQHPQKQTIHER